MADLVSADLPLFGYSHGSRGPTSTESRDASPTSDDLSTVENGLDSTEHPAPPSSSTLTVPPTALVNQVVITAPQQVVAPSATTSINPSITLHPQQVVVATAAPITVTPTAAVGPANLYQLIVRGPLSQTRFARQHPPPHLLSSPPPPALNLMAIPMNQTNNGEQLIGIVPHEAQPPMGRDVTMSELMLFGPNWLRCPEVAMRAIRNGHETAELVDLFFNAYGAPNVREEKIAAARIRKHLSDGAKLLVSSRNNAHNGGQKRSNMLQMKQDLGPQLDLTANAWELRAAYVPGCTLTTAFAHVKLAAFYATVPTNSFPTGREEGALTKCLRFARGNQHLDLDTSHWDWIMATQGF